MTRIAIPLFALLSLLWAGLSFALFVGSVFGDCAPDSAACATKDLAAGIVFWRWLAVQLAGLTAILFVARRTS